MAVETQMKINSRLDALYVEGERELRQELATCYHLVEFFGWNNSIFNHISMRVPGTERHFLINPFGLNYSEITASNLVKIDLDGNAVGQHCVNYAGFLIHGAIHAAREDAHCIIHSHAVAASAVAGKQSGLSHDSFSGALLYDKVAYHDFEGVTLRPDERGRLAKNIGMKPVLILRNHGVVVTGRTIPQAFFAMWILMNACEVQCAVDHIAGPNVRLSEEILAGSAALDLHDGGKIAKLFFDAAVRRMKAARREKWGDVCA